MTTYNSTGQFPLPTAKGGTGGTKGAVIPGTHNVAPPKWQNTRQVQVATYNVCDDTGSVMMGSTGSTTLDIGQMGGNGGHMVSANLPGTIQVNRNQISGTGTTFTTSFAVGDILNLPDFKQSRKITTIYTDTEMYTDAVDNFNWRDWQCMGSAALSTTQAKFGTTSLATTATGSCAQAYPYEPATSLHSPENTIELWFNLTNASGTQTIISCPNGDNRISVSFSSPKMNYYLSSTGTGWDIATNQTGNITINGSVWNHLAIVSYAGTVTAYINGVVDYTWSSSAGLCAEAINVPRLGYNGNNTNSYQGYLSQWRASACARYNSTFTPPTKAFVPDYYTISLNSFDGVNGSQNMNASEIARPTPVRWDNQLYGNPSITTAQKKFGGASLALNGSNGVSLTTGIPFNSVPTQHCLEFFLYSTVTTASQLLVNTRYTSFGYSISFNGGKLSYSIGNNGTSANIASGTGTTAIAANTWYHIALSYDGTTYRLFCNGNLETSQASSTPMVTNWAQNILLGVASGSNGLQGNLDATRFSLVPRYTANFTAPTAPFTLDANTVSLNHFELGNGSQYIQGGELANAGVNYQKGGLARQTHYYPYVVGNATTSQIMISPKCKSYGDAVVDLPTGMTYIKQLKFALTTNYNGNLYLAFLSGSYLKYLNYSTSVFTVLSGGNATSYSTINLQNLVPKISRLPSFILDSYKNGTAVSTYLYLRNPDFNDQTPVQQIATYNYLNFVKTACSSAQLIQYLVQVNTSYASIYVNGYDISEL